MQPQVETDRSAARPFGRCLGAMFLPAFGAVCLLFRALPKFGFENLIFPAIAGVVGLHFFPMPLSYRHRVSLVTGSVLIIWAISCTMVFRHDGDRMAAFVCFGAGLTLWASAAWAPKVANKTYKQMSRSN